MGAVPTCTVAITVFVAVLITDTVLSHLFATYTRDPSGVTATPMGRLPTATVSHTVFVEMSRTDTSLLSSLLTYANGAAPAPDATAKTTTPVSHASRSPLMALPPPFSLLRLLTCPLVLPST